ncbi:hypothetical protein RHMOL_Rhmol08G0195900 [Rhododendron molle]|uniref:Uncharacterized protein n=1 Tax=Rhododendron molle TaxID=49168 RepID=A0ACC0MRH8_RHOML|nr:hypothetical protein RHMOL_Rhmol08G0195900 [Rhododendron molle]
MVSHAFQSSSVVVLPKTPNLGDFAITVDSMLCHHEPQTCQHMILNIEESVVMPSIIEESDSEMCHPSMPPRNLEEEFLAVATPPRNIEKELLAMPGTSLAPIYRGQPIDNRDVVPYKAYLSRPFNCHINVEVCVEMRCLKYIHKYIFKGNDRATMVLGLIDEIKEYLDARYIGSVEATWQLFSHSMHEEIPTMHSDANINVESLNEEQRAAYTAITTSVFENKGMTFFLNGGAETGKTFLYNTVATKYRNLGHVVVSVASSVLNIFVGNTTTYFAADKMSFDDAHDRTMTN